MFEHSTAVKKIDLNDRHILSQYIQQFPPYNDFEFLSLWVYNVDNSNTFHLLNGNLVIKIQDFVTGDFFYSFLGTNKVKETAEILLERSRRENLGNKLRLIPEINIQSNPELNNHFIIKEDPDSFDYVLSVDEIADLRGGKYYDKRNLVNNFIKNNPGHTVKYFDFTENKIKKEILELFNIWEQKKGKQRKETLIELAAIKKLLDFAPLHSVTGLGVYSNNQLVGFITYHIVHNNYAIISFEKGNIAYKGIYPYLLNQAAKHLKTLGVTYINYEQDLGIPGLKKGKMLWRPVHFLKKYTLENTR